jgi:hypothetical protein
MYLSAAATRCADIGARIAAIARVAASKRILLRGMVYLP